MTVLEALQLAKTMKRPMVYICNGYILGTDETFSSLSRIILPEYITDLVRPFGAEFNKIYYGEKLHTMIMKDPEVFHSFYQQLGEIYINTLDEDKIKTGLLSLQNRCGNLMDKAKYVGGLSNITQMPEFESMLKLKTGDGMIMYKYTGPNEYTYMISTFVSIHPVTKSDSLDMQIYDIDGRSFLAQFTCKKKKSLIIEEYIRYRYLGR